MPTPITFPAIQNPSSIDFRIQSNSRSMSSPFDRSTQTIEMAGGRWICAASWEMLSDTSARQFNAFVAKLRGQAGRFYFGPSFAQAPLSVITGAVTVNGANQVGGSLVVDGFTGTLKTGDYIHFDTSNGRELKIIVADLAAPGTLLIEPPIRTSPADNTVCTMSSPTCVMKLTSDDQAGISISGVGPYAASLDMVEAFLL